MAYYQRQDSQSTDEDNGAYESPPDSPIQIQTPTSYDRGRGVPIGPTSYDRTGGSEPTAEIFGPPSYSRGGEEERFTPDSYDQDQDYDQDNNDNYDEGDNPDYDPNEDDDYQGDQNNDEDYQGDENYDDDYQGDHNNEEDDQQNDGQESYGDQENYDDQNDPEEDGRDKNDAEDDDDDDDDRQPAATYISRYDEDGVQQKQQPQQSNAIFPDQTSEYSEQTVTDIETDKDNSQTQLSVLPEEDEHQSQEDQESFSKPKDLGWIASASADDEQDEEWNPPKGTHEWDEAPSSPFHTWKNNAEEGEDDEDQDRGADVERGGQLSDGEVEHYNTTLPPPSEAFTEVDVTSEEFNNERSEPEFAVWNPPSNADEPFDGDGKEMAADSRLMMAPTKMESKKPISLTSIPEEEEFQNRELEDIKNRQKLLYCHICCLWLIILLLIAMVIIVSNSNGDDGESSNPSTGQDNRPEPTPVPAPAPIQTTAPTASKGTGTLAPTGVQNNQSSSTTLAPTVSSSSEGSSNPYQNCFASIDELQLAVDEVFVGDPNNQVEDIYGMPIGSWCFTDNITSLNSLFAVERNPNAATFNADISGWDVSKITDMGSLFDGAAMFNSDLSTWDVSQNKNLSRTFSQASVFNTSLTAWKTSAVEEMRMTFYRATNFNQNIATWDVAKVTTFEGCFLQATSFNQNLAFWQLTNAVSLGSMFFGAQSFAQNLCAWGSFFTDGIGEVENIFVGTLCPAADTPTNLTETTPGPFCFSCDKIYDLICYYLPDCSVLNTAGTPQNSALEWLRKNPGGTFTSDAKTLQRYALATLYYSTDGAKWVNNALWLTNVDECLWYLSSSGNACSSNRLVVSMEMKGNGLYGALPVEMGLLNSLENVKLSNNTLMSSIPTYMGKLVALQNLTLSYNYLTGVIPSELGALSKLQLLRLNNNDLTGTLPTSVCNLATGQTQEFFDCEEVVTTGCVGSISCCSQDLPCNN